MAIKLAEIREHLLSNLINSFEMWKSSQTTRSCIDEHFLLNHFENLKMQCYTNNGLETAEHLIFLIIAHFSALPSYYLEGVRYGLHRSNETSSKYP